MFEDYSKSIKAFNGIDASIETTSEIKNDKTTRFDQLLHEEEMQMEHPIAANTDLIILVFGLVIIAVIGAIAWVCVKFEKYKKRTDFRHKMDDHEMSESSRLTKMKKKVQKYRERNSRIEEEVTSNHSLPISTTV